MAPLLRLEMPLASCREASSTAPLRLALLPPASIQLLLLLLPLMLPASPWLTNQVSLTNKVQGVKAEVVRVRPEFRSGGIGL